MNSSTTDVSDPLTSPLRASRTSSRTSSTPTSESEVTSTAGEQLVGENQNLEKPYLRLTTFPRKQDVRPLTVLHKSLEHIKERYLQEEDFAWANEQLKSVRQDITVQGIRNSFVLQVYETHSRILLEHGDLNEFNQCQTMIRSLTEGTVVNDNETLVLSSGASISKRAAKKRRRKRCQPLQQTPQCADEFRAYAILYALVQRSWMQLKKELMRVQPMLGHKASKSSSSFSKNKNGASLHALAVVHAVEQHNYRSFFALYNSAPHMSVYLMDFMLKRVRVNAYERIISAFRPSISLRQVQEWMGFMDESETRSFLKERGATLVAANDSVGEAMLDCKACCAPSSG